MKRKRDITVQDFGCGQVVVIAADNSGGIGSLPMDEVNVPYEVVAQYGARVCALEVLAAGAVPVSFIIHSFNGEEAWGNLVTGAQKTFAELGLDTIEITGSTESNMNMIQSASSFTMIGRGAREELKMGITPADAEFAVIGVPLVGDEVMASPEEVISLSLFSQLLKTEGIYEMLPVGSKGIRHELEVLCGSSEKFRSTLPMDKSAGPSTCVLISYDKKQQSAITNLCGMLFHELDSLL
ncbi:ATPase [Fictibacillus fluitans]|uniref:ATPase n=1 Tax=Fictibacillus fluitans TaxID=3058422 RepID=A0ABT8HYA2_9BACL|nr:ATPase [Fictibacillus sp. NE201]MDN4525757.1 ATPase [Fictibacillus sp. NE201]